MLELTPPSDGRILLHCCCAPCSSAILECMLQNHLDVAVFFSNSNIVPREEYEHRKQELIRYCNTLGVSYFEDDYDHEDWLGKVGYSREQEPERGARCLQCFTFRLKRAARFASQSGFSILTTTLASSRWKNIEQINAAGERAVADINGESLGLQQYGASDMPAEKTKLIWWGMNWRKGGLQDRRVEIIREQGFYNQLFCGCEFSCQRDSVLLFPPAKINLGLNVIRRREDGFHDIETLFYPVYSLHDTLKVEKSEEFSIEIEGATWNVEKDLSVRAFRLMQQIYGIGNVHIHLKKQIPTGAGLGGGSSDCAYTIKALNTLFRLSLTEEQMCALAQTLGSDCAFFIRATPQWGEGKGEVLSAAPDLLKDYEVQVVMPDSECICTAEAYKGITPRKANPSIRETISSQGVETWKNTLHNDFEDSVFPLHPHIKEEKERLYEKGAVYASMSGSGAAVYGIFKKTGR